MFGIAQAIIHKPKLVVMDEPTNGLDPNQLIEVRKLIKGNCAGQYRALVFARNERDPPALPRGDHDRRRAYHLLRYHGCIQQLHAGQQYPDEYGKSTFARCLQTIKGATKAEFLTDKKIRLYFDGDQEITERLIAASMEQGWRLREISLEKGLLEDVFKQLSTQSH